MLCSQANKYRYSYLAKVQQMHPQAQLPQSAAQRNAQAQQKKDQPDEFSQYQKYQEVSATRLGSFSRHKLTRCSNNAVNKSKKRRKLQRHHNNNNNQLWRHQYSMTPAASWIRTTSTTNLSKTADIMSRKACSVHNPAPASISRKVITDTLNRDMEATIAVSSRQDTILTKFHLISISRVNLMSLGVRAMMICGDRTGAGAACKLILTARNVQAIYDKQATQHRD